MEKTFINRIGLIMFFFLSALIISAQNKSDSTATQNDTIYFDYTLDKKQTVYETKKMDESENRRNTVSIGYQIGGVTLVGAEYEIRFSDYVGLNMGIGVVGFTAGIKIHTTEKYNSPYFLLSFKDGGLGLVDLFGLEFGGRILLSKRPEFGFVLQGGLVHPYRVDPILVGKIYNGNVPFLHFFIGVGITFPGTAR
ncbi:MAG: hypothetical protein N3F62_06825 [Bacteroidia bacterium]|nr:hypothetical protein [Bacteroidia bacterium]